MPGFAFPMDSDSASTQVLRDLLKGCPNKNRSSGGMIAIVFEQRVGLPQQIRNDVQLGPSFGRLACRQSCLKILSE